MRSYLPAGIRSDSKSTFYRFSPLEVNCTIDTDASDILISTSHV